MHQTKVVVIFNNSWHMLWKKTRTIQLQTTICMVNHHKAFFVYAATTWRWFLHFTSCNCKLSTYDMAGTSRDSCTTTGLTFSSDRPTQTECPPSDVSRRDFTVCGRFSQIFYILFLFFHSIFPIIYSFFPCDRLNCRYVMYRILLRWLLCR